MRRRLFKLCPFVLLGSMFSTLPGCYSIKQYRGDGEISHPNRFWHPKYTVVFPEIDLSQDGHYSFEFSGAPSEKMHFTLDTEIPEPELRRLAAQSGLQIRTVLEDDLGRVLFDESARSVGPMA